jgi:AcrR family transcriptional regulator
MPPRRRWPTRASRWRPHSVEFVAAEVESKTQSAPERILDAACDLIAAEGIDEVRIARVARRAGASTALVHHYFSTREELLEQALIHSFEQAGDERFVRPPDAEETATEALARGIAESLPFPGPQEREWVLWVELWLRAVREPALRPVAARLYGRYRDWVAGLIRAGVESGEFRADADPEALADIAMALLDGTGVRALISDPEMEVERARALVAERLAAELGLEPDALR